MSLKDALTADLSARGMNLGALADRMGISQQSISKWIARDEIPQSRHEEVREILGAESATVKYLGQQLIRELEALQAAPMFSRAEAPPEGPSYSRRAPEENAPAPDEDLATGPPSPKWYRLNIFGDKAALTSARPYSVKLGVAEHLEPQLRKYADRHLDLNGQDRKFDYLSATVAVKVVFGHPGWMMLNPLSLTGILLLRATRDETRCVVAQLPAPRGSFSGLDRKATPSDLKRAGQFASDMALLGIEVMPFDSYAALAEQIDAWETAPYLPEEGWGDY